MSLVRSLSFGREKAKGLLPTERMIMSTLKCSQCAAVHDLPEVNHLEVGLTHVGAALCIQVWCTKHNVSIFHQRLQRQRIRRKK